MCGFNICPGAKVLARGNFGLVAGEVGVFILCMMTLFGGVACAMAIWAITGPLHSTDFIVWPACGPLLLSYRVAFLWSSSPVVSSSC